MILNYRFNNDFKKTFFTPIIFIHGLFGDLSNFNMLSRKFNKEYYSTLQIDLRNHGQSPHHLEMNYKIMAQDILDLLNHLSISQCIVIGHSLGGKVAMTLPKLSKDRIIKMIIIDIAPITYTMQKHYIFTAINYVNALCITKRSEAFHVMKKFITNSNVISFLLKSFKHGQWNFSAYNIQKNYAILNQWENYTPWSGDVLFVCGEHSSYVKKCYYKNIYQQFPKASIHIIPDAGHWVHSEKCHDVYNIIDHFLS